MDKNIYYMSIQSTSLAHYLNRALILPARFYHNRPSDIQNIENDYLVLSKKKFLNDSNVSIELILTDEEIDTLKNIENNILLYSKPIPISRIKQVYFRDETQKSKTIDNINKGTAFIPTTLSKVIEEESINRNIIVKDSFKYSPELESKIKTYNHILGGLAFVRYTIEGKHSENYFSILSHFNKYIYDLHTENKDVFKGYDGAFTHKGKVWNKLSPLIYKDISEKDVLNFSQQEKIAIDKSNGIFKYDTINSGTTTYKLAILNTYGENSSKRKKTNDLISDCRNGKIPKEKQEGVALIYGINNGYSTFRNQYDKKIVKFKMDSLLDYYTIESVFQYVINDKKDNEKFEYIDEIFSNDELVLDILPNGEKESFDLEHYLKSIANYFQKNQFTISPKELIEHIVNEFKNIFIKEMGKKDIKIRDMQSKIEELEQENQDLKEKVKTKVTFDEEKERIIIEQTLETYLKYDSKKVPELRKIAKEKGIKFTKKSDTIKLILAHKDNRLL